LGRFIDARDASDSLILQSALEDAFQVPALFQFCVKKVLSNRSRFFQRFIDARDSSESLILQSALEDAFQVSALFFSSQLRKSLIIAQDSSEDLSMLEIPMSL